MNKLLVLISLGSVLCGGLCGCFSSPSVINPVPVESLDFLGGKFSEVEPFSEFLTTPYQMKTFVGLLYFATRNDAPYQLLVSEDRGKTFQPLEMIKPGTDDTSVDTGNECLYIQKVGKWIFVVTRQAVYRGKITSDRRFAWNSEPWYSPVVEVDRDWHRKYGQFEYFVVRNMGDMVTLSFSLWGVNQPEKTMICKGWDDDYGTCGSFEKMQPEEWEGGQYYPWRGGRRINSDIEVYIMQRTDSNLQASFHRKVGTDKWIVYPIDKRRPNGRLYFSGKHFYVVCSALECGSSNDLKNSGGGGVYVSSDMGVYYEKLDIPSDDPEWVVDHVVSWDRSANGKIFLSVTYRPVEGTEAARLWNSSHYRKEKTVDLLIGDENKLEFHPYAPLRNVKWADFFVEDNEFYIKIDGKQYMANVPDVL